MPSRPDFYARDMRRWKLLTVVQLVVLADLAYLWAKLGHIL